MKRKTRIFALFVAWMALPGHTQGQWTNEYYVDCTNGSDNGDGRSPANAWRTIAKAASTVRGPALVRVRNGPCLVNNVLFAETVSGVSGADCRAPTPQCTVFRGENANGAPAPVVVQLGTESGRDGFILGRNVRNVRFEYFDFLPQGTTGFDDAVLVRGTASNLYFKNIRVMGRHARGISLHAGYNVQRPGLFDVVLDSCVAQDTSGTGFRIVTDFVCAGNQGVSCPGGTECDGRGIGPCGSAEAWNITFLRSFALNNRNEVGAEADGFSAPHDRTYNIAFEQCVASGAGGDGFDVGANFREFPNQMSRFLDVTAVGNGDRGIYVWHSAHIENAWVARNAKAGVRSARNTSTNPPDTTTARITILNATVVGNENRQISLGERGGYADARVFNTIAYSTANSQSEALEYNRSAPSFSMAWDWNVFYREGGGGVVVFGTNQSCSANQVPNCDGSHPNSIGAAPQFKDANWNYLREGSPGWDQGQRPSLIPQLSGFPIYRAETADHDGNARPYPAGGRYDIGAFEGPGGCAVMPRGGGLPLVMAGLGVMVALRRRRRSFSRWLSLHRLPLAPRGAICAALLLTAFPSASIALACLERSDSYNDEDRRIMLSLSDELCVDLFCGPGRGDPMYAELNDKVLLSAGDYSAGEITFLSDLCALLPSRDIGCELFVREKGAFRRPQTLVKDINPGRGDGIAYCPQPIVIDDVVYFVAHDGVHGQELWRSDGTSDGTWMVKDVNPGAGSGISGVCRTSARGDPSWVALGNVLIFVGFTPEHGYELWRSDGTQQGTWLLRDIWPGPRDGIECGDEDPVVPGFVVVGDKVLFKANDGVTGLEPWVTDGTAEGTRLLADTVPGSQLRDGEEFLLGAFGDRRRRLLTPAQRCEGFINAPPFTVQNGLAFFTANEVDPVTGGRVERTWRTDGTPEGTYPVNQAPAADGGCAVAAGGVSVVSMFAGFALLLVLRRVHWR